MKTCTTTITILAAGFIAALTVAAGAQDWRPSEDVSILVGTAPGGDLDLAARQIQNILRERKLVQRPVIVLNKPGAGSAIAWTYLNQRPGNGEMISISAPNLVTNKLVGSHPLNYKDVTPLATLYSEYIAFSVRPDSPLKTGKDLIEALRKNPGSLTIGIASALGATNHIAAGTVLNAAGIDLKKVVFVVFRSSAASGMAMMGGHVDVDVATVSNVAPQLQGGRLRVLGVTSPERLDGVMANVPTWKEQGIDAEFAGWRGMIGPKGLSEAQIAFWDKTFATVTKTDEWKKDLRLRFGTSTYKNSAETAKYLALENDKMSAVLTALGLTK